MAGWQNLRLTEEQLPDHFTGAPQNVGGLLGSPSGDVVDCDLDWPEASELAQQFLPTSWSFGRGGVVRHVLVKSPGAVTTSFDAPVTLVSNGKHRRIVEILATGRQAMMPGSTHPDTNEVITWINAPEQLPITNIAAAELVERVSGMAAFALLVRLWPELTGTRHDIALALAGALHHAGWPHKRIEGALIALLRAADEPERHDRAKAVADTLRSAAAGKPVTGVPRLAELLSDDVMMKLKEWLRLGSGPALTFGGKALAVGQPAQATLFAPQWQEPDPLPLTLLKVEPFDLQLLPASLRPWCADIAERIQCPPEFPAVGAMVALASVIGRKAGLRPKRQDDWTVIPTLWGMVVGRPGIMKSPALGEAVKPLGRLEIAAFADFQEALRTYKIEKQVAGLTAKAADTEALKLLKGDLGRRREATTLIEASLDEQERPAPVLRRYRVNNTSYEALGEILIENPFGTLVYADELASLLRATEKEGQEEARGFYLQAYDALQPFTFDRILRGRNLRVEAPCISLLGGIQPGKLRKYIHNAVTEGSGDDGLLQRFGLLVWPDTPKEWVNVDRWPDTAAKQRAFQAFHRLDQLQPGKDPDTGEPGPQLYQFDPAAQEHFDTWRHGLQIELRSETLHPAMESHLAKYPKLVASLALVCALADGEALVSEVSVLRALSWIPYLRSHAERVYAAGTRPDYGGANALLLRIRKKEIATPFSVRDVYRNHWAQLSTPKDAQAAVDLLCELGYLMREERPSGQLGGRPTAVYHVHPANVL